jgi:quercetin dioxygenase-like cupin family protein
VRILLEPGASSPAHAHPGPELGRVEGGTLTVRVEGPALIKRRDSGGDAEFTEAPVGEEFQLERGEQIAYLPGTKMTFRNASSEQTRVLSAVILPGGENAQPGVVYDGEPPGEEAFNGVTSQILGDGLASALPTGGATIVIERIRLTEEGEFPGERNPTLISLESGVFAFRLVKGLAQVSRTAEPGPRSPLDAESERSLKEGDAVFFPQGVGTTTRDGQSEPVTFIRLVIAPTSEEERLPSEERGTIRFLQPERDDSDDEDEGDDEQENGEEAGGETVYVNSNDVNVRAAPSSSGVIVATLPFGAPLRVTGPVEERDGVRWVPVVSPDDPAIAGYVSEEFLSRQPDGSEPLAGG